MSGVDYVEILVRVHRGKTFYEETEFQFKPEKFVDFDDKKLKEVLNDVKDLIKSEL